MRQLERFGGARTMPEYYRIRYAQSADEVLTGSESASTMEDWPGHRIAAEHAACDLVARYRRRSQLAGAGRAYSAGYAPDQRDRTLLAPAARRAVHKCAAPTRRSVSRKPRWKIVCALLPVGGVSHCDTWRRTTRGEVLQERCCRLDDSDRSFTRMAELVGAGASLQPSIHVGTPPAIGLETGNHSAVGVEPARSRSTRLSRQNRPVSKVFGGFTFKSSASCRMRKASWLLNAETCQLTCLASCGVVNGGDARQYSPGTLRGGVYSMMG